MFLHKTLVPQICSLDVVRFIASKAGKPEKEGGREKEENGWVGIKQVQRGVLLPFLSLYIGAASVPCTREKRGK